MRPQACQTNGTKECEKKRMHAKGCGVRVPSSWQGGSVQSFSEEEVVAQQCGLAGAQRMAPVLPALVWGYSVAHSWVPLRLRLSRADGRWHAHTIFCMTR